jgi:peptidoglycan/xylan/chitin deacetylase (PgdA/CDA1 family)
MSELTVCLTHDVDRVYKTYQYLTHDVRHGALGRLRTLFNGERPYWQFERICAMEDRVGARSTFFFLEETIRPTWKPSSWKLAFGRYRFTDRSVAELIRALDAQGWEVGVHGSYNSYRSLELLRQEKASLEAVLGKPVLGIRQHYLNLDVPGTWRLQREAGFRYDASFGKRRGIGYRDGRRHCFVDPSSGMFVVPLSLMECYLFADAGHNVERAWSLTHELIDEAQANGAVLSVLWHPHMYYEAEFPGYAEIYQRLLAECASRGARFATCAQLYAEANATMPDREHA